MIEWLKMGGYGFYVWSSYGMLLAALAIELVLLRRRRRAAWERVDEIRGEHEAAGGSAAARRES